MHELAKTKFIDFENHKASWLLNITESYDIEKANYRTYMFPRKEHKILPYLFTAEYEVHVHE